MFFARKVWCKVDVSNDPMKRLMLEMLALRLTLWAKNIISTFVSK